MNKATVEVSTADDAQDIVPSDAGRGIDPAHLESSSSGDFGLPSIRQQFEFMGEGWTLTARRAVEAASR